MTNILWKHAWNQNTIFTSTLQKVFFTGSAKASYVQNTEHDTKFHSSSGTNIKGRYRFQKATKLASDFFFFLNPTTGLVAFGVSDKLRLQNF